MKHLFFKRDRFYDLVERDIEKLYRIINETKKQPDEGQVITSLIILGEMFKAHLIDRVHNYTKFKGGTKCYSELKIDGKKSKTIQELSSNVLRVLEDASIEKGVLHSVQSAVLGQPTYDLNPITRLMTEQILRSKFEKY